MISRDAGFGGLLRKIKTAYEEAISHAAHEQQMAAAQETGEDTDDENAHLPAVLVKTDVFSIFQHFPSSGLYFRPQNAFEKREWSFVIMTCP